MTEIAVAAILWKKVTETNFRSLKGELRGEYDLRLGTDSRFRNFFSSLPQINPTALGGYEHTIPIEPFDGPSPVPATTITLRYMGPNASRANDTYFKSQQPGSAYDLWRVGRAFPPSASYASVSGDRIAVIKDVRGGYHARWIPGGGVSTLPKAIRAAMTGEEAGVLELDTSGSDVSRDSPAAEICKALLEHHNVLLYGPPATGKTHLVQEVMALFGKSVVVINTQEEHAAVSEGLQTLLRWVTFHQSYSYEDFVVGLRPDPSTTSGLKLNPVPGILLHLTEWARVAGRGSLLVIDEINRGNTSRVFGEFITLMEPDKRLDDDGNRTASTVEVNLPYIEAGTPVSVDFGGGEAREVPVPFSMPLRVYTLATMNSVDKSVAPLDAALRRRFHLINLFPDLQAMAAILGVGGFDPDAPGAISDPVATSDDVKRLVLASLAQINRGVSMFLGPEFQLGQWYLARFQDAADVDECRSLMADLWNHALFPQLEELFNGRVEQLIAVLSLPSSMVDEPSADLEELGGAPILRDAQIASESEAEVLLRRAARVPSAAPE